MKFKELAIEITRKCNLKCEHCSNGGAQNITITKEIIDKIFKDVEDCERIGLIGGESLLEIEIIEYLVTKIMNNWTTNFIQLTTNGTIQDKRIINILENFCNSNDKREALFRISADEFHDVNKSNEAFNFYSNLIENSKIELIKIEEIDVLVVDGFAIDYFKNNPNNKYKSELKFKEPRTKNHRIRLIDNNIIPCLMVITVKGDLAFIEQQSYENVDKSSIGNILENSIKKIILNHNNNCLLTCCDSDMLYYIDQLLLLDGITQTEKLNQLTNENILYFISKFVFNEIYKKRIFAKKYFPLVSPQDIILTLQMPKDYVIDIKEEITKIYDTFLKFNKLGIYNIFSDTDIGYAFLKNNKSLRDKEQLAEYEEYYTTLALLKYPGKLPKEIRKEIELNSRCYRIVTCSNPKEMPEFIELKEKNDRYNNYNTPAPNDKILGASLDGLLNKFYFINNLENGVIPPLEDFFKFCYDVIAKEFKK